MKPTDKRHAEAEYIAPDHRDWEKHGLFIGNGINPIIGKRLLYSHMSISNGLKEVSTPKRR